MTVDAEPVLLLPVPAAGPFAMQTGLPLAEYRAVALAAEFVGFVKIDQLTVRKPQFVTIVRVVTVKAPAAWHMFQHDVLMHLFKLSRSPVYRHSLVTLRTGEDAWRKGWRRDKKLLLNFFFFSEDTHS